MIQKVKRVLLCSVCVLALLGGMTACEGLTVNWGTGNEDDNGNGNGNGNGTGDDVVSVELVACWHLVKFCGEEADADIYIDFGKDGKFTIYQRTAELTYTVFKGTYTVDEEKSEISGVYADKTPWLSSYTYVLDKEQEMLTLTSVETPSEVSEYELSEAPTSATIKSRSASISDVKPL